MRTLGLDLMAWGVVADSGLLLFSSILLPSMSLLLLSSKLLSGPGGTSVIGLLGLRFCWLFAAIIEG